MISFKKVYQILNKILITGTRGCKTLMKNLKINARTIQILILCFISIFAVSGCSMKNKTTTNIPSQSDSTITEQPNLVEDNTIALDKDDKSNEVSEETEKETKNSANSEISADSETAIPITIQQIRTDYQAFLPNEAGRIPVVMFHKFVEAFEPDMDKSYTNTFEQFQTLLQTLYDNSFRLVSMQDFLSGHIDVPAGFKPIVFTFDDGAISQYNLIENAGTLELNPLSAVGFLAAFHKLHPDFGLKGMFFLNMDMGDSTFRGAGILKERLLFLEELGFEIGTHTWGHIDFRDHGERADVEKAIGKNEQALLDILPDQTFTALALPYGSRPKDKNNRMYLGKGTWENTNYSMNGVFAVGAGYAYSVFDKRFDYLYIPRVRATGKDPVEADFDWWLENASEGTYYISDGNPESIVVPVGKEENIATDKLGTIELVTY